MSEHMKYGLLQLCIQSLIWAHNFLWSKNRNEAKGVGFGGEALRKKILFTLRKFLKHAEMFISLHW